MSAQCCVEIRLFGSLSLVADGVQQRLAIAGATQSLLQYLVCFSGRAARRDLLVELFWPNVKLERRRAALNSAIWRIKKALKPFPGLQIDATAHSVCLDIGDDVACDAICLARAVQSAADEDSLTDATVDSLAKALARCEAPLLDGLDDDWAVIERERLLGIQLRGLTLMMHVLAERKHYEEALDYGRRILALEPFRESTIQEAMCLCVMSGQRAKALCLYQRFAKSLQNELAIAPMAETLALYNHLVSDRVFDAPSPSVAQTKSTSRQRPGLDDQLSTIERSRLDLYRSMRSISA